MLKNVQTVVGVEMSSSSKNFGVSGLILVKSSPPCRAKFGYYSFTYDIVNNKRISYLCVYRKMVSNT